MTVLLSNTEVVAKILKLSMIVLFLCRILLELSRKYWSCAKTLLKHCLCNKAESSWIIVKLSSNRPIIVESLLNLQIIVDQHVHTAHRVQGQSSLLPNICVKYLTLCSRKKAAKVCVCVKYYFHDLPLTYCLCHSVGICGWFISWRPENHRPGGPLAWNLAPRITWR